MRFIIDSRQHPRDPGGLWKPSLAAFQGPALLAWNNTVFSDADWRNIGKMHQSVKEEDVLKVGRFGLGFQSVHHLTGLLMSYAVGSLYIVECMHVLIRLTRVSVSVSKAFLCVHARMPAN